MSLALEIEAVSGSFLTTDQMMSVAKKQADSTDLLRQFLAGDDAAFTQLYTLHNKRLYAYCIKILRDPQEAEDALHTAWEKVIALRLSSKKIDHAEGLLYRAARNQCFDRLRSKKHTVALSDISEAEHPSSRTREVSAEEELVLVALDRLPEETKEILLLHYYSDYSFEEIALMLGKKPNAIWTRVSRARAELRATVEKQLANLRNGGIR